MIRACERCGAATRRQRFCTDRCAAAARQQRLRDRDRDRITIEDRTGPAIEVVRVSVALAIAAGDWEPAPDVEDAFRDEIVWKKSMINARRRSRCPIPRIDRDDLAALDEAEEGV